MQFEFAAPCYFGTERSAAYDFERIGAQDIRVTDGRILFRGDENTLARANLESRCTERILLLLRRCRVTTFDELFDAVSAVSWEDLMPADAEFPVKGSSLSSTLSSVPACQSIVKKSIVEKLKKGHGAAVLPESGPLYKVRFTIRKDELELYLDTSGEGLHKRGYRERATEAPIKETLAATIVDLARISPDALLQDPFCGSGTMVIEAALKALRIAPGMNRHFLAEQYSFIPQSAWTRARQQAQDEIDRTASFEGIGFDVDPHAIHLAENNARIAGVHRCCRFFEAGVDRFAPAARSIVLANPPYGERMGTAEEAAALEKTLGERIAQSPVAGLYVISSDENFEQNFGKKARRRRKLYNGMIPCQLYMYF